MTIEEKLNEKQQDLEKSLDDLQAAAHAENAAKVEELKAKHNLKEVFVLKVGGKTGYLRKPNRKDIAMARSLAEGDEVNYYELLLDAVWLGGDEEIRKDDDYFFNSFASLGNLIESKKAELKKS